MKDEQALNEKLAKWSGAVTECAICRGTGKININEWEHKPPVLKECWSCAGRGTYAISVEFPRDLNACFSWLVPKIPHFLYLAFYKVNEGQKFSWDCNLTASGHFWGIRADTPPLALCLAIEKLVDAEANTIQTERKP